MEGIIVFWNEVKVLEFVWFEKFLDMFGLIIFMLFLDFDCKVIKDYDLIIDEVYLILIFVLFLSNFVILYVGYLW